MAIDNTLIDSEIAATEAQIAGLNSAIVALSTGTQQSYTIDTGQTKQTVEKKDLAGLIRAKKILWSELQALCARRHGGGTIATPGW